MVGKKFRFFKRKDPEEESLIRKNKEGSLSSGVDEIQSDEDSEFAKVKAGGWNKNKYSSSKPNPVKKMFANKYHELQNIISSVGLHGDQDQEQVALLLQRPSQETEGFAEFQSYENSEFSKMKAGRLNKNQSCSKADAVKKLITNQYHKLQNWTRTVGLDGDKDNDLVAFLLERPPEEAYIKNKDENAGRVGPWNPSNPWNPPPELVAVAETPTRPVITANKIIINHPGQQVAAKTETAVTSAVTCNGNTRSHVEREGEAHADILVSSDNALATCSKHSELEVAAKQKNPVSPLRPSSNCDKNCQKTHSEPANTRKAQEHLYNLRCMFTKIFSPRVWGYQQWRVEQHQ